MNSIREGDSWPKEILIIDSGKNLDSSELNKLYDNNIRDREFASILKIISIHNRLFPGSARNIGCKEAKETYISFLDVNTIPSSDWLSISFNNVISSKNKIVFGSTKYIAKSNLEKLFIYATYGDKPVKTLPGTILHADILREIGLFLPHIRAAEDTDWLIRAEQFSYFQNEKQASVLSYSSVPKNIVKLSRKWFRNYRSCSPVVFHLESHKSIYFLAGNLLFLFIAFNWNNLIADWKESNFLYLANITKITFGFLILFYSFIRGILMPKRRGTSLRVLLPIKWIWIVLICLILDISKLLAFIAALPSQYLHQKSNPTKFNGSN